MKLQELAHPPPRHPPGHRPHRHPLDTLTPYTHTPWTHTPWTHSSLSLHVCHSVHGLGVSGSGSQGGMPLGQGVYTPGHTPLDAHPPGHIPPGHTSMDTHTPWTHPPYGQHSFLFCTFFASRLLINKK